MLFVSYSHSAYNPLLSHQKIVAEKLNQIFPKFQVLTGQIDKDDTSNLVVHNFNWKENQSIRNIVKYYISLTYVLIRYRPKTVFFHMTTVQAAISAPFLRILGINVYLWYAHKSDSVYLRIAHKFSNLVLTSTTGSFPFASTKLCPIGQMVDSSRFFLPIKEITERSKFIHIGRLDPSKHIEEIISIMTYYRQTKNKNCELIFVGDAKSSKYSRRIGELLSSEQFGWVKVIKSIPNFQIVDYLSRSHVFIHAFQGSMDKSIIEATLVGLPVITSNFEYQKTFGNWSNSDGHQISLKIELENFEKIDLDSLHKELKRRQQIALDKHSLSSWVKNIQRLIPDTQ